MKVSLSWLKDYVNIEMDVRDLASALTMAGLEVESVTNPFDYLGNVLVGRIVEIRPHPNAAKLKLCRVDTGNSIVQVVCGAPNIAENIFAPLALPGTVFPDGSILKTCDIRGQLSEGMLCSEKELELGDNKSGVMILSNTPKAGTKISEALSLSDFVLEIGLTPNRSDCLSVIGIAREIAAIQKLKVVYPDKRQPDRKNEILKHTSVKIEAPEHCPRYAAALVTNITVSESPFWLRKRLLSIGQRPINNIVDITNFVMMECGQPLHAFDFNRLAENRIVVRTAEKGETFVTLDQKERILDPEMLMICDGKKPVAIAGVMGGLNSEIGKSTKSVLIESAYFDPLSIRKTSKKLGLSTEASFRFERGLDPLGTVNALMRAAHLMTGIGNGKLIGGVIDENPIVHDVVSIELSISETGRLLGMELNSENIKSCLESIEFDVENIDEDTLKVIPPSFRVDITRSVDLIEEAARLYGYNSIPTTFPLMHAETTQPLKTLVLRNNIKNILAGLSFTETINYSFINELSCDQLRLNSNDTKRRHLHVINPINEEQGIMRTSLIPGLLETMRRNLSQQVRNLKLFETGNIFLSMGQDTLPEEVEMVAGLWTGDRYNSAWYAKETSCDFYDMKGIVEGLMSGLNINNIRFTKMPFELCCYTKQGYTAQVTIEGRLIGIVGEVHSEVLRNFNLKQKAFIFELNCNTILDLAKMANRSRPLPKFPFTARDISIIISKDIEAMSIIEKLNGFGEKLIENTQLFDVFDGGPVPPGKRSVSVRIIYRSSEKTLEDNEVNGIHINITNRLLKELNASLSA
ncbi:MAG: phenylalanine--tRNA ligase subunit beta [Desulfobacterales bacterium]